MPIKFSEEFSVNGADLLSLGVFDVILDVDTHVFIDPALLPLTSIPETRRLPLKI